MSPYMSTLLVALLPFTAFALPNPVAAPANPTAVSSICAKDVVYLQLAAPVLASTASKFCSSYIRPTISATGIATVTQTTTAATTTQTVYTATVIQKRALTVDLAALAPSALLSSACSCLLVKASPTPTTVYSSTQTITTTATLTKTQKAVLTCSSAAFTSPIQNGDFSQGSAYWTVVSTTDDDCNGDNPQAYCFNGYNPGFTSYGVQTTTLSQSLVTCIGTTYQLSITFKSEFCAGTYGTYDSAFTFDIDGQVIIDGGNQACYEGVYPYLDDGPLHTVNATFTAQSNNAVFSVYNSWPGDDAGEFVTQSVVITPVQQ